MKLSTSIALRASVVLFSKSAGIASVPFLVGAILFGLLEGGTRALPYQIGIFAGLPLGSQLVGAANGGHICSIWRSGSSDRPGGRLRLRPFLRGKGARSEREAAEYARLHAAGVCSPEQAVSDETAVEQRATRLSLKPYSKSGSRNQAAHCQLPFVSSSDFLADSQS
jgi:hypothetical protein